LVPKKIQRCFSQAKKWEPDDYFYFDPNGPTVLGQIFGSTVGVFFVLGEKMGRFLKNPKNVGQKKYKKVSNPCRCIRHLQVNAAATFFFARIFFSWGKLGKIFFDPTNKPRKYVRRAFNPASEASLVSLFVVLFV
jgi:hypothetical protein